jgi:hypothetical protein
MNEAQALKEFSALVDARIEYQAKTAKAVPHRIKWKGKYIRTKSGKTVWKRIGDAKSAFKMEISNELRSIVQKMTNDTYVNYKQIDAFYALILKSGLVEFVPYEEGSVNK